MFLTFVGGIALPRFVLQGLVVSRLRVQSYNKNPAPPNFSATFFQLFSRKIIIYLYISEINFQLFSTKIPPLPATAQKIASIDHLHPLKFFEKKSGRQL
jgi:hypothetical protein